MAQIIYGKPPMFDEASKLFGVTEKDIIFYSYGDKIFSPAGKMPPDDLLIHEGVHAEQQAHDDTGAKLWWQRYMIDPEWRVEQEAEAFGEQLRWLRRRFKDRNTIARYVHHMASSLSGPMYGKVVDYTEAAKRIKAYADGTAISEIESAMPEADIN